jgi:hypothetical protein
MRDFDDDYQSQKAFVAFYNATYRDMSGLPPELRPDFLLAEQEKEDPKRAIASVRTMVNRIVAQSFRWSASRVARLEAELGERELISLAALRARFQKEYKAIIKRGELRDHVEYYMAKELVDADTKPTTRREREKLEEMMAVFGEAEVAKFRAGRPPISS